MVVADEQKEKVQKARFYVEGHSEINDDKTKTEQNLASSLSSKNSDKLLYGGVSLFFLALVSFFF
ncbi:MAG: hypothetical protein NY202_05905 [Mollicutes bacterium UO1]